MCWPQASSRFMRFLLAWVSQREQQVARAVVLLLHRGLLWQKGKIREFFPSILFHSLGKKNQQQKPKNKPNNKTGMPVISCRSGTALLIYFKVSFRTVCLISTLHGTALPKGGKAPLPGKLVSFFSPGLDALCFIPPDTGEGKHEPKGKQDGWDNSNPGGCLQLLWEWQLHVQDAEEGCWHTGGCHGCRGLW